MFDVTEPKNIQEVASVCGAPVRYATILTPPTILSPTLTSSSTTVNTNNNCNIDNENNQNNENNEQKQILKNNETTNNNNNNKQTSNESSTATTFIHSTHQPLMAIVNANNPTVLKFFSLQSHSYVHELKFKYEIFEVRSTRELMIVMDDRNLYWFDSVTLSNKLATYPCYSSKSIDHTPFPSSSSLLQQQQQNVNNNNNSDQSAINSNNQNMNQSTSRVIQDYSGVMAVGARWIAYPSETLVTNANLDFTTVSNQTYAEMSLDVAKKAASGIFYLGELGAKTVSNYIQGSGIGGIGGGGASSSSSDGSSSTVMPSSSPSSLSSSPSSTLTSLLTGVGSGVSGGSSSGGSTYGPNAGVVEIRDLKTRKLLVQFRAHTEPIACMRFDPSGTLLITTSILGTHLNIYQILPSSNGKISGRNIVHLYRLFRGVTTARLKDVQFSGNSKWVAVSSTHGTTHLFAINPNGGSVDPTIHLPISFRNSTLKQLQQQQQQKRRRREEKNPISVSVIGRIHSSSSIFSKSDTNPVSEFYASKTSTSFFSNSNNEHETLYVCNNTGILSYNVLQASLKDQSSSSQESAIPFLSGLISGDNRESSPSDMDIVLQVSVENSGKWNLCRSGCHEGPTTPVQWIAGRSSTSTPAPTSNIAPYSDEMIEHMKSQWISNVEIDTYERPMIPLWLSGNFKFKTFEAPSEESAIYPELKDIAEDTFSMVSQMSKSVHIKVSEPIPISRNRKDSFGSTNNYSNHGNVAADGNSQIFKAMSTPLTVPKQSTPSPTESPFSLDVDHMRKSCLKNADASSKMRKSVRLSVDTPPSSEARNTTNTDEFFTSPNPTIEGKSSQELYMVTRQSNSKPTITTDNLVVVRNKSTQGRLKTPSPSLVLDTDARTPVLSPEKISSANGKVIGQFDAVPDYFGGNSEAEMTNSLIGSHAVDSYIGEEEEGDDRNHQEYEQEYEGEEEGDHGHYQPINLDTVQHYEPLASVPPFEGEGIEPVENQHMDNSIEFESEGSDEEVEVRRSQGTFHINNDFFSKNRPSVHLVDSYYDDYNEDQVNVMESSHMESTQSFVNNQNRNVDYDFESDDDSDAEVA